MYKLTINLIRLYLAGNGGVPNFSDKSLVLSGDPKFFSKQVLLPFDHADRPCCKRTFVVKKVKEDEVGHSSEDAKPVREAVEVANDNESSPDATTFPAKSVCSHCKSWCPLIRVLMVTVTFPRITSFLYFT
ncbi:unnamed protein product [Larinioides sclopetarius]|uniref:Uncharacterized protein n=1 Tax=Larinioides sclopetarius TaxID=280406 RepID=A0AAV1Z9S1_9ARAC